MYTRDGKNTRVPDLNSGTRFQILYPGTRLDFFLDLKNIFIQLFWYF